MAAIEQSLSQLRHTFELLQLTAEPSAKPVKTKSIKTKVESDPAPKAPSAWNLLVQSTVTDMKQNGWESWTDAKGTVWPASRRGPIKDKSGAQSEGFVYDGGENDGKAPSPALGGMVRASYLKAIALAPEPEAAGKLPQKASATASAASAEPKKAGRPKMTAEQKAAAAVKRAAAKASASADQSGSESSAMAEPKKAGRPKMTAEQKAAAAVKRAAAKASEVKASDAESVQTCSSDVPAGWAELLGENITPKKVDLSFYPFKYEDKSLIMNDRGDVVDPEEGVWVGRLTNGLLDKSVPEPEDLEGVTMRE